jgi:1-aminocyclopropane-1-carboxylate deaminase
MLDISSTSPLQKISLPCLERDNIQCFVKRDDQLDTVFQGNKYRKLKYNLHHAVGRKYQRIISFGGAYSNHLHALSFVPEITGLPVTVYIRGEINDQNNTTLQHAKSKGIELIALSRGEYLLRHDPQFLASIKVKDPDAFIIPEGGTNHLALIGMDECGTEIREQLGEEPDYCLCAVGSGGTFAGLINSFSDRCQMIGVSAFAGKKAVGRIEKEISNLTGKEYRNWTIMDQYHFGGFAKMTDVLFNFIYDFYRVTDILLDPIYTSKMTFAFTKLVSEGYFIKNSKVVLLHTGGLQGWNGMRQRFGTKYAFKTIGM